MVVKFLKSVEQVLFLLVDFIVDMLGDCFESVAKFLTDFIESVCGGVHLLFKILEEVSEARAHEKFPDLKVMNKSYR